MRIALNIAIAFFVGQARADKKCYKPSTAAQLQAAVDETQSETFVEGVPNILLLCAGTEVTFKKGDPKIKYKDIGAGNSYVMRCESYAMKQGEPCVIDGGGGYEEGESIDGLGIYKPADNSDRRLYVGDGGFIELLGATGLNLFFEGLVIKNFSVTGVGGAMWLAGKSNFFFLKCIFFGNNSKLGYGGALVLGEGHFEFKECNFNLNVAENGGAIFAYNGDLQLDSCLLKENIASYGGAINSFGGKEKLFNMRSVAFVSNVAISGGGIYYDNMNSDWFDVDFSGNEAADYGDAYLQLYDVTLEAAKLNLNKDTAFAYGNKDTVFLEF